LKRLAHASAHRAAAASDSIGKHMRSKTLLIVLVPPLAALTAVAVFNPEALTWPLVGVVSVVVGVFGAFVSRLLED